LQCTGKEIDHKTQQGKIHPGILALKSGKNTHIKINDLYVTGGMKGSQ
jgi:hypothetical protein